MAERIYVDAKYIWSAIQRLREANANMNMVENEIARVISEHGVETKGYAINRLENIAQVLDDFANEVWNNG